MKSKNIAFFLNFLLPGAGLAYLGKWKLAALNLGGALAVGVILGFLLPESFLDNYGRYVAIGIGSGSGAWAMMLAEQMNLETSKASTVAGPSEQD